ncbi:MAG TPA: glucokinase [Hyphomicrobiales bacterium]|nr:glucokinase [Hyphomicrobiales bacterium]
MAAPVIVADIGGTYSRFALVGPDGIEPDPASIIALENERYGSLGDALADYGRRTGAKPGRGVFAVAGPIDGHHVKLTNRDWVFDTDEFARDHGLARLDVVNDFVALARALPYLHDDELTPLGAPPRRDGAKVALGPGTGLGVAGLLHVDGRWIAVPSEAGHVECAAIGPRETALFDVLRKRFGRVQAETVISGPGLSNLDHAIRTLDGQTGVDRDAPAIVAAATAGEARAEEAVALLLGLLARFAGDMALAFLAHGGVYLAGGVLAHLAGFVEAARFRTVFADKAPFDGLLAGIAVNLVRLDGQPALRGCAAIAGDHA